MDENSIIVPSKCTKLVRNNEWSDIDKEVIIEKSTKKSNVICGTSSSSVSVLAEEKDLP